MTPQSTIAHYRIASKLGEGGMGTVYRATDTKLHRDVAIKVLPAAFAADPDRLARFTREAQVVASLNHPNIAAIYGVEDSALILELVEGPTLAERLEHGPIPLDETLAIARQIADALEYAHDKGVVHRDLKPANVKITPQGRVKVLDFGLAKALTTEAPAADPSSSPTMTMSATMGGVIMGTAAYMSPEQAKGKDVDRRADIWAFGVVLWEMLTGRQLFGGETVTDILANVLTKVPDWDAVPLTVRRLLQHCLERDPNLRLRAIGDWGLLLDNPAPVVAAPDSSPRVRWILAGALVWALVAAAWGWLRRPDEAPASSYSLYMVPPEGTSFHMDSPSGMQAISPDGRMMAFIAEAANVRHIWLRPLDSPIARALSGTELADGLFWSPDARFLGFTAGNNLKMVDIGSGAVKELIDAGSSVRGAAWGPSGTILFGCTASPVRRISFDGGPATPVTVYKKGADANQQYPQFLPDGKHFLYWVRGTRPENSGVYAGSLDVAPEGQIRVQILATPYPVIYAPPTKGSPGQLLFLRGKTLFAQPFNAESQKLEGSPVAIAESAGLRSQVSVSRTGILTTSAAGVVPKNVTIVSRDGSVIGTSGRPDFYNSLRLSPDTRSLVLSRRNPESSTLDLWLMDLASGNPVRLTDDAANNAYPAWSPDGKEVIFGSNREGPFHLFRKAISGSSSEQLISIGEGSAAPDDYSRDGKILAYTDRAPDHYRAMILPLVPAGPPLPVSSGGGEQLTPHVSPSGKWVAFASNETGTFEIYVQGLPGTPEAAAPKVRVSTAGGQNPAWSADGSELFFNTLDDRLMAAAVKAGPGHFEASAPNLLFPLGGSSMFNGAIYWEPIGNGQRFVVLRAPPPTEADNRINVIVNWQSLLHR